MQNSILWELAEITAIFSLCTLLSHFWVRHAIGWKKALGCITACAGVLSLPLLLPSNYTGTRMAVACFSLLTTLRFLETAYHKYPDPKLQSSLLTYIKYLMAVSDVYAPKSGKERAKNRRLGYKRMGRGLLKQIPTLMLFSLSTAYPLIHDVIFIHLPWVLLVSYFCVTGFLDIGSGFGMARDGYKTMEIFNNSLFATSPRDFWSRRWNLTFRNSMHRLIFVPLNGAKNPALAVTSIFACSAILHEYIVIAAIGYTKGHMTIFFILHGVATMAQGVMLHKRSNRPLFPKPVAIALHNIWFIGTSYWFFTPFLTAVPFGSWRLW